MTIRGLGARGRRTAAVGMVLALGVTLGACRSDDDADDEGTPPAVSEAARTDALAAAARIAPPGQGRVVDHTEALVGISAERATVLTSVRTVRSEDPEDTVQALLQLQHGSDGSWELADRVPLAGDDHLDAVTQRERDHDRALVMEVAAHDLTVLTTYDAGGLEHVEDRAEQLATDEFAPTLVSAIGSLSPSVPADRVALAGDVLYSGVVRLDGSSATTVSVLRTTSTVDGETRVTQAAVELELQRSADTWLVSGLKVL